MITNVITVKITDVIKTKQGILQRVNDDAEAGQCNNTDWQRWPVSLSLNEVS